MSLHLKFDKYLIVVDILSRTLVQAEKDYIYFICNVNTTPSKKAVLLFLTLRVGGYVRGLYL